MKNLTLTLLSVLVVVITQAQSCPVAGTSTISTNPNTYYPGTQATVNTGATSITIGAAAIGTTPISIGDLVLIIQMQGAEFNSTNSSSYGDGVAGGNGNGYLNNTNHLAGNMEYAIASNNVPLAGGTLILSSGTSFAYQNSNYVAGSFGQYRYQVIRVSLYYNATLGANITAPNWDGNTGGVLVLHAVNNFSFAGFTLNAAGAGFRGGGSRQLAGDAGTNTDYRTSANNDNNGSKGEGTAGTPRYLNNNGSLLNTGNQGYPNGSHGRGAPGNAGGAGTDGNPSANDENSGGGGGGNGGTGGRGGNSWNSNLSVGGEPAANFAQRAANRVVMGGGGGSGTTNNGTGTPGTGFASSGAAGGGIVIVNAKFITSAGTINVNGADANNTVINDASGGGGGGGSALILSTSGHSNVTVSANGGNGGTNTGGGVAHGPGGGGAGGVIFSNGTLNGSSSVTAGIAGTTAGGINFGAANGTNGILVQNSLTTSFPLRSNSCVILPLTLLQYRAYKMNNDAVTEWATEQEINFQQFEIERSTDGVHFIRAGVVQGRGGSIRTNYAFTDVHAADYGNKIYYRLKMVDKDGLFKYSTVELVRFDKKVLVNVRPTLATRGEKIVLTSATSGGSYYVRLFNLSGKEVYNSSMQTVRHEIPTENLSKGFYVLRVISGATSESFKIIVQ